MRLCVRLSWRKTRRTLIDMVKVEADNKPVSGGIHPKGKSWRSVTLKFAREDGDKLLQAAKDTGRSVAGFVRFAALKYVEEVENQN